MQDFQINIMPCPFSGAPLLDVSDRVSYVVYTMYIQLLNHLYLKKIEL
jgi:hypothetical protein